LTPRSSARALAPVLGEQAAAGVAEDYRLIATDPAALALDADTSIAHQLLGVPVTPIDRWAADQDWDAIASFMSAGAV
jgi:hypothetical protein